MCHAHSDISLQLELLALQSTDFGMHAPVFVLIVFISLHQFELFLFLLIFLKTKYPLKKHLHQKLQHKKIGKNTKLANHCKSSLHQCYVFTYICLSKLETLANYK